MKATTSISHSQRIALETKEKSLISLHKRILKLLQEQPPESRQLIEQLIDYYNKIILCMPSNVYWIDKDNRSVSCNQNVLDMFGLETLDDFFDLSFEDMGRIGNWSEAQGESFKRDTNEVIKSGKIKPNVEEPPIPDANGDYLYFITTRVPLFNALGDVVGIVGISTDISERKRFELALEEAKEKAEIASAAKSEFLANLGHDIRTPLGSLMTLTEYLTNKVTDHKLKQISSEAHSCAEQLMQLMDEILEINEMDLGHIPKQDRVFNLQQLISSVCCLMTPAAKEKGLSLKKSVYDKLDIPLVGKSLLIHRVLLNLLSNAIKFSHKGRIEINANIKAKDKNKITITLEVKDRGIGIPAGKKDIIFEQFERLSSAYEGQYSGRGLGLYIVKQYGDILNAKINLDSKLGVGTTFSLDIPLVIANKNDAKNLIDDYQKELPKKLANVTNIKIHQDELIEEPHYSDQQVKILLVEDVEVAQVAAKMILTPLNCHVITVSNGKGALAMVKKNNFDLIFLDIGLPDISGIEVAKQIRAFEIKQGTVPIPIIALTAHLPHASFQQSLSAGIQQVIRKPLSSSRAKTLLMNWIDSRKLNKNVFDSHVNKNNTALQEDQLKENINNNENRELFEKFLAELPKYNTMLESAFKHNDRQALKTEAHSLHGLVSFLNLPEIKRSCKSLECAILDEFSNADIASLYTDLAQDIKKLLECQS